MGIEALSLDNPNTILVWALDREVSTLLEMLVSG